MAIEHTLDHDDMTTMGRIGQLLRERAEYQTMLREADRMLRTELRNMFGPLGEFITPNEAQSILNRASGPRRPR
jgi:hypothetical protein